MRELGSGDGSLLVEEADDAREVLDVLIFPDAEIGGADAAFGYDSDGFSEDGSGSSGGTRSEVD